MKRNIVRLGTIVVVALAASAGLGACGSSDSSSESSSSVASAVAEDATQSGVADGDDAGVKADLEAARQVVLTTLEENGDLPKIMLASDVTKPEEKYGMLVVPYIPSDASEKIVSTVNIENGKFEITGVSAETGKEYVINQDGEISEN